MADLAHTDAEWLRFLGDEVGQFLRLIRHLVEIRDRMRRQRTQYREYDPNENVGDTVLAMTGAKYGDNTDSDGTIYQRITGGPTYTVSWYKATGGGGGDLVSQGTAAASNTATMAEQNSSGLSGTYKLAAAVTTEADDRHTIRVYQDYPVQALLTWDGTDDEDVFSRNEYEDLLSRIATVLQGAIDDVGATFSRFMVGQAPANPIARGNEFLEHSQTALINDKQSGGSGTSDVITVLRTGALEALRSAMEDETTGAEQFILRRVVAAAAGVAGSNNQGAGTIASHTPEQGCPVARYELACIRGEDTEDGGREQFRVSYVSTSDYSEARKTLPAVLTVKKSYKGTDGFGPIVLLRTPSKTNDGSDLHLAALSGNWTETGESSKNTNGGVLYWKVVADGATFHYEFYDTLAKATGDLVAATDTSVAAATAFVATARNGSGLQINMTSGSAPVATTVGTVDLKFFHRQNSNNVPDSFTIAVSLTSEGLAARLIARIWSFFLNGTTSGSETIEDGILVKAGTFEPFLEDDN